MKTRLEIKQTIKLSMNPLMQQAIHLLQLSREELELAIRRELDQNPLLEYDLTEVDERAFMIEDPHFDNPINHPMDKLIDTSIGKITDSPTGYYDYSNSESRPENSHQFKHSSGYSSQYWSEQNTAQLEENPLKQHLLWQLQLTPFSNLDYQIALTIIDALDEIGYLGATILDIQDSLNMQGLKGIEEDEIVAVLHRIQQFDPEGIAARDLSECLAIQLRGYPSHTPWLEQTKTLVLNYLELLAKRDYAMLASSLNLSQEDLIQVLKLITQLNPRPGSQLFSTPLDYIQPDVLVRAQNNIWVIELNKGNYPKLRVNRDYAALIKHSESRQDTEVLRNYLVEAQWFLKSLQNRDETLLKVARCIIKEQQDFFQYGEIAMRPLALKDVANKLNLHESTVSRITNQKYVSTPKGLYELKYFFSNSISTAKSKHEYEMEDNQETSSLSATAIRARIKKILAEESSHNPLSDQQIMQILGEQDIHLSRRTISKYRIAMNIPTSKERRLFELKKSEGECINNYKNRLTNSLNQSSIQSLHQK